MLVLATFPTLNVSISIISAKVKVVHTCDLKLIISSTASAIMWLWLCALMFLTWKEDGKCLAAKVSSSIGMLIKYRFSFHSHALFRLFVKSNFFMHTSDMNFISFLFVCLFFSFYSETSQSTQQILERKAFQHFRHMGPCFCLAQ